MKAKTVVKNFNLLNFSIFRVFMYYFTQKYECQKPGKGPRTKDYMCLRFETALIGGPHLLKSIIILQLH